MKSQIYFIKISYIVIIVILFSMNLQKVHSNPAKKSFYIARRFSDEEIDTEDYVTDEPTETSPTISPESKTEIIKELEKLMKTVEGKTGDKNPNEDTDNEPCATEICKKLKKENAILRQTKVLNNMMLKPAYPCDEWHQDKRICYLTRNMGNSVTFVLATPPPETAGRVSIEWRQEFAYLQPRRNRTYYHINPRDPPWNIVIGSRGHELRLSPITETDLLENIFTAVVHFQYGTPIRKIHFAIRPIVINIGLVYPGATMTLHIPSFISLPSEGMTFKWELYKNQGKTPSNLPSNMRPSPSGASLSISELRKEQEGIILCSIYSNLGVHAARVGFDILGVDSDNNKLVFIATRPPHKSIHRKKRSQQLQDNPNYFIDSPGPPYKNRHRNKRSPQLVNSLDYFGDSPDIYQADTDYDTDGILKLQVHDNPPISKYLKNRSEDKTTSTTNPEYDPAVDPDEYKDDFDKLTSPVGSLYQLKTVTQKQKRSYIDDFDQGESSLFDDEMDIETPKPQPTRPISLLERHKQAILARLRGGDRDSKHFRGISNKRLLTTTEMLEILVDVEEDSSLPPFQESDRFSKLIGKCERDLECSLNAECVKRETGKPGFCRCLPKFEGNGIFCWEGGKWLI